MAPPAAAAPVAGSEQPPPPAGLPSAGEPRSAEEELAAAEAAYAEIDFERAGVHAERALRAGGHSPRQTLRIHFLRGVVHSALGQREAARGAFVQVLLLEPALRLERTLAPRLRGPYMEARAVAAGTGTFGADVRLHAANGRVVLTLSDPLGFTRTILLRVRASAGQPFTVHQLEPRREQAVEVAGLEESGSAEYAIQLHDEHGNTLWVAGSELAPLRLPEEQRRPAQGARTDLRTAYYVAAGVMGALGAVSLGVGVPFHVEHNDRTRELGGLGCQPNSFSYDPFHCQRLADEQRELGTLRLIAFGIGGALVTGGVVALLLAAGVDEQSDRESDSSAIGCGLQAGPSIAAANCSVHF